MFPFIFPITFFSLQTRAIKNDVEEISRPTENRSESEHEKSHRYIQIKDNKIKIVNKAEATPMREVADFIEKLVDHDASLEELQAIEKHLGNVKSNYLNNPSIWKITKLWRRFVSAFIGTDIDRAIRTVDKFKEARIKRDLLIAKINRDFLISYCKEYGVEFEYFEKFIANFDGKIDGHVLNKQGQTPLISAIALEDDGLIRLLVRLGANPNFVDSIGNTPLLYAVSGEYTDQVLLLKELGADLNLVDKIAVTPLILAIDDNSEYMVRFLKKEGADLELMDLEGLGDTPYVYALLKNKVKMIELLEELGVNTRWGKEIYMTRLLAHVWGLEGEVELGKAKIRLEGLYNIAGMKLLHSFACEFLKKLEKDPRLSEESRKKILNATSSAFPLTNLSNDEMVKSIKNGQPCIIESGTEDHGIAFVVKQGNLIVCNRGDGGGRFACEIFELPDSALTPELIKKLKVKYKDIDDFKKMLEGLDLKKIGGYKHKDQSVGNCAWASAKAAFDALLGAYIKNEKERIKLYKEFTEFCRESMLEIYLQEIDLPNPELLKLVQKKTQKKSKKTLKKARALLAEVA